MAFSTVGHLYVFDSCFGRIFVEISLRERARRRLNNMELFLAARTFEAIVPMGLIPREEAPTIMNTMLPTRQSFQLCCSLTMAKAADRRFRVVDFRQQRGVAFLAVKDNDSLFKWDVILLLLYACSMQRALKVRCGKLLFPEISLKDLSLLNLCLPFDKTELSQLFFRF